MTTNVPNIQFTPTGLLLPQEAAVLAGVQADINEALGGGLNPALETPQGQLASSQSAIIADKNAVFAEYVNQINPDTASGAMQDVIARIYFLNRKPALPTTVQCQCIGDFGTIIPVGAQVQDTSGNIYVCTQAGSIPIGGTVTLSFACTVSGPIACPSNTVTRVYRAIPGWNTVNNSAPGVAGADVETQAAFAYRRQQSVALNAQGSLPSVYANVFNVDDVLDVYAFENVTGSPMTVGATSYSLVAHSLYVAVVGGVAADIAQAIWAKKGLGCNYNGNTTVTVVDPSGYLPPYPSYPVKFQIPAALPIKFAVQLANSALLPANIVDLVRAAIIASFTGADGSQRVRMGSLLLAAKFYPGVVNIAPVVSVLSVLLGSVTATLTSQLIGIDQAPTVQASDITVTLV